MDHEEFNTHTSTVWTPHTGDKTCYAASTAPNTRGAGALPGAGDPHETQDPVVPLRGAARAAHGGGSDVPEMVSLGSPNGPMAVPLYGTWPSA